MNTSIVYIVALLAVQLQGILGLDFIAIEDGFCRSNKPHRLGLYTKYKPVSFERCKQECENAESCTAIEYHFDTQRCEVHYWDIVEVDPVSSSRREGKVKCYTVCKSTSCAIGSTICYSKLGDGACYGIGSGTKAEGNSPWGCYDSCSALFEEEGCKAFEYDHSKKTCKIFKNGREPRSTDSSQRGKVCFKAGC